MASQAMNRRKRDQVKVDGYSENPEDYVDGKLIDKKQKKLGDYYETND